MPRYHANAQISLGDTDLRGTTIAITIANHKVVMDIYTIPTSVSGSRLLVLQDNLDDSGKRSKEGAMAVKLLQSSFELRH